MDQNDNNLLFSGTNIGVTKILRPKRKLAQNVGTKSIVLPILNSLIEPTEQSHYQTFMAMTLIYMEHRIQRQWLIHR